MADTTARTTSAAVTPATATGKTFVTTHTHWLRMAGG